MKIDSSLTGAHFSDRTREIFRCALDRGEVTPPELASVLGIDPPYMWLRRMVVYGLLENPSRGVYRVPKGLVDSTAKYGRSSDVS